MKSCQDIPLEPLLQNLCDAATESEIQQHLDNCVQCQKRLEQLAADPETWSDVAAHLANSGELELDKVTKQRLANTQSIFVLADSTEEAAAEEDPYSSWMQILDPPAHPEALGKIDQFEIESKIGQGGMGIVLKGLDRELDRSVAIKVLAPHLASNGTARKRFAREAQAAAAVVHPNVVPIYSVNQNAARPYIVMQLVSGRSLQSVVDEDGPLPIRDVVRIAIQIADGLAAAHEQGLIHRDVKPANVLTERDVTRVMITDFGLARAVDDVSMTQTGWLTGTPHYMSPEQARGDDVDPRSDLFSLGSLMYFLATGRVPFRAERSFGVIQKIINESPTLANVINPHIRPELASIIAKLHEKEAGRRYQSATELADLLRDYLSHLQQPNRPMPPIKIAQPARDVTFSPQPVQRWMRLAPLAVVALVAFAVSSIGFWMLNRLDQNQSAVPRPTGNLVAKSLLANPQPKEIFADYRRLATPSSNLKLPANAPPVSLDNDKLLQDLRSFEDDLRSLETSFGVEFVPPQNKPDSQSSNHQPE